MISKDVFSEGIDTYKYAMRVEPALGIRPSERQYTAILAMKEENSAYADYSLIAPHDTRTPTF